MLQAVCFDLDGTLFDDRQYVRAGLRHAAARLESLAGVELADELVAAYFERGITEGTFDTVLDEHGISQEYVPELVDAYHDNDSALEPYPAAEAVLSELEPRYDLGLITGGRNGREKLTRLGLDSYFDTVVVTSGRPWTKREAEPFELVLEAVEAPATDTAFVGDRPDLDFPQANQLGMWTVRVETGRYADADATGSEIPDESIPTIARLPDLLSEQD